VHNTKLGGESVRFMEQFGGFPEWVAKTCEWFEDAAQTFRRISDGRDNVLRVRYEDLATDKQETLSGILRFLGAETSPDILDAMIEGSSLEAFRAQSADPGFFRKGQVDFGAGDIPGDLRRSLMEKHKDAFDFLGYGG